MFSITIFLLLLLASPSFSLSPRSYSVARGGKAPRFPSGKYRPINAKFVRRSPIPAGAAGGGAGPADGPGGQELAGAPVNNITVTPSNVVQCATATITWTGAAEPVDIQIGQGGFYVGITPITTLSSVSGGSASWIVNQASGETLIFELKDADGAVGYIQNIAVGASGDSSCLAAASSAPTASASVTDSSTPSASATATDDGDDSDATTTAAAAAATVSVTSSSAKITTSLPTTTKLSSTQTPTPSTTTYPAGGDLGNAALASNQPSASASATATSGSPAVAVVSMSFLAVIAGLMAVVSFISL